MVSYSCIRQWVLRTGLGVLQLPIERRNDWTYIIDFSIQLGKERCLLILGVTQEQLHEEGYQLSHHTVQVLDIYVQGNFNAEKVFQRLQVVQSKTGVPYQVISDHGTDVKKGINLFCEQNRDVISSYDVTHMIGIHIKHALQNDKRWISLQQDLLSITQQTKQTELSFLRPVAMTKKSRWLNVVRLIEWLENIYKYESEGDFSLIDSGCKIKNVEDVFCEIKPSHKTGNNQRHIKSMLSKKIFANTQEASIWLASNGMKNIKDVDFVDAGQVRFNEKFEILRTHKSYFYQIQQLCRMSENIKAIIKNKGLSLNSLQEIEKEYDKLSYPWVKQVYNNIVNELVLQHSKCGIDNNPLLCCSDIIESIFGKFKVKAQQTVGGIYQTVLIIALISTNITTQMLSGILTKTKMKDVDMWFKEMMGKTNLTKRRTAFDFVNS